MNKAADLAAKGIDIRTGDYTDFDSMVQAFTEQLIKAGIPEMYVGFTAEFAEAIKRGFCFFGYPKRLFAHFIMETTIPCVDGGLSNNFPIEPLFQPLN